MESRIVLIAAIYITAVEGLRELIVNGFNETGGRYPFYVYNRFGKGAGCGATLIHEDIILSAAHCRKVFDGRGAYIGSTADFGSNGEFHEDDLVIQHPEFDPNTYQNDVMLVKLQTSSSVSPILLNRDVEQPAVGTNLTIVGYGDTEFGGDLSPILLEGQVAAYDFPRCSLIYAGEGVTINEKTQFCAYDSAAEGGVIQDACQGDSGSPIFDENMVQMGIVSFGLGCARPGIPAAYVRISTYTDWIDETVCILSSNPPERCRGMLGSTSNSTDGNSTSEENFFIETNLTEAKCEDGSACMVDCQNFATSLELCFEDGRIDDSVDIDSCWSCVRLQNATLLLDDGTLTAQEYVDRVCNNGALCRDHCGGCFTEALEFGRCAWDCDIGNLTESTTAPTTDSSTSAPTGEPTQLSNVFDREEETTAPMGSPAVSSQLMAISLYGLNDKLNEEELDAFLKTTNSFLQLAGDSTIRIEFHSQISGTPLEILFEVSSARDDRPGFTAVDVINRSQQSKENYVKALQQESTGFNSVSLAEAQLVSSPDDLKKPESSGNDKMSPAVWGVVGALVVVLVIAIFLSRKLILGARKLRTEDEHESEDEYSYKENDDEQSRKEAFHDEYNPEEAYSNGGSHHNGESLEEDFSSENENSESSASWSS